MYQNIRSLIQKEGLEVTLASAIPGEYPGTGYLLSVCKVAGAGAGINLSKAELVELTNALINAVCDLKE